MLRTANDSLSSFFFAGKKGVAVASAMAWNFGPDEAEVYSVQQVVEMLCAKWGAEATYQTELPADHPHEAHMLRLDCSKAKLRLGWKPQWKISESLDKVVEWTQSWMNNEEMVKTSIKQIRAYMGE